MNGRNIAIVGGIAAAMGLMAWNLYEPTTKEEPTQTKEAATTAALPKAVQPIVATKDELAKALDGLEGPVEKRAEALEAAAAAFDDADEVTDEQRDGAVAAVEKAYEDFPEGPGQLEFQKRAAGLTASFGGAEADEFVTDLLGSATDAVKLEIVREIASSRGAHDRETYEAALDAALALGAPDEQKAALMRRALGRKAEGELLALLEKTDSPSALRACAVELQEFGKPELLSPILGRLDAKGLLDDGRKMPWFSGQLLSKHIESAKGEDLARTLKVVKARPALAEAVAASVVARLEKESDPAVKGVLEDSLAQVRSTRPPQQGGEEPTAVR